MTKTLQSASLGTLRTSEFPWTAETIYLNNASIGPIPERTRRALDAFTARRTAPHLFSDPDLMQILRDARQAIAQLLNAGADEIALSTNTSYGLGLAARSLPLVRGDAILVSDREFPANVYPWIRLRDQGIDVDIVPCTPEGWPDEQYMLERIRDDRVRVVSVSLVQFANGYRVDLDRLSRACRAHDVYLVVDAIQGLGCCPLDVRETPVDILACGGQKWLLSPWGSGFLYVRRELIGQLEPALTGWMAFEGTDDFSKLTDYRAVLRADARRFELNTLPYQDFHGMLHSLQLILELDVARIADHTDALQVCLIRWAQERGMRIVSPIAPAHRSAIFCFAPRNAAEAYHSLNRANVICSFREGSIRISPHVYNTIDEVERVIDVLEGEWLPPACER